MFDPSTAEGPLANLTMTELLKRRADVQKDITAAEIVWMEASEALEEANAGAPA